MACSIQITSHNLPGQMAAGSRWFVWVCTENLSASTWPEPPVEAARLKIAVLINQVSHLSFALPRQTFDPCEKKYFYFCIISPQAPGIYGVNLQLVAEYIPDGRKFKADECQRKIRISQKEDGETSEHLATAMSCNSWFYLPSQGMTTGRSGRRYPIFIKKAIRSRFVDSYGRRYIDYVMGWGSALLGHAHPGVCKAVSKAVKTGSMLSLPHLLEMKLSRMLCDQFEVAESVLFGKNGSDVTTAAMRLSRIFTGREKILFCGYHGWQDGCAESVGFGQSGVPGRTPPLMHPFKYGDIEHLKHLMKQYSGQVAAVMVEPAGVIESIQGPIHDADEQFLKALIEVARESGTLVVFDEIMTGFRYLHGSVHQCFGLFPDLVCLGKGLSAGMPLSAVAGRADIFHQAMPRINYHPTFKGDVCSLAAAHAALSVYRKNDVPGHIWRYGGQLARGLNALFDKYGTPASVIGPPFRMGVRFTAADAKEQSLLRTLLHQELIKNGIFTFNTIMLPSYAHKKSDLRQTFKAFDKSLQVVRQAIDKGNFAELLEIPEVASHTEPMCLTPEIPV